MRKEGFVSTALIYTFFILFLVLMVFLLNSYSSTKYTLDRYRNDIEEELYELSNADINMYTYVWDKSDREYKYVDNVPRGGYKEDISYCKNRSTIIYSSGEVKIQAKGKDFCYLYFDALGEVTKPVISASDGKESGSWHNSAVNLSFSGGRVENGVGEVVYYYGNSLDEMTSTGTSTGLTSVEGMYYVKACNSYNTELCSESAQYDLKIDNEAPSCNIEGNPTSWQNVNATLTGSSVDSGEGTVYYSWDNNSSYSDTLNPKEVSSNGTYTLYVKDSLGNETSCNAVVSKIDKTAPSISFSISGIKTATYTCSNGGSGSPLTGTTSGSKALSGTSNITYTVTCQDEAGNSKTDSHTYKYSSCASGENTCSSGCSSPAHWEAVCPAGMVPDGWVCTSTNHPEVGDCKKKNAGGWYYLYQSGGCQYVSASGCSSCYYGHNTCQAGFKFN